MLHRKPTLALWLAALPASGLAPCSAQELRAPEHAPQHLATPGYGPAQVARSRHGGIATPAARATDVGAQMLASGGNAVDAAVAAAFALAVVQPSMSGLGGRTQILVRTDAGVLGVDGTTQVPRAFPAGTRLGEGARGYATVGVPGTVAALARAVERAGTKSLAELIAPAIELAAEGFPLSALEAERIAEVARTLRKLAGSRRHFLKADGSPYRAGERFSQPALARVLRAIAAEGPDVFYRGWIAERIAADMAGSGGYLALDDLRRYRARDSLVVRGSYRGFDLVGTYLPASGATTIEALHILEELPFAATFDTPAAAVRWASLTAQALSLSFTDRAAQPRSPEHAARLVSKAWAARRARDVRVGDAGPTPGRDAAGRTDRGRERDRERDRESPFTAHISVADGRGGWVALTQSIGPSMGSKVASPDLGFLYAATMGYLAGLEPGDHPFSSQSPLLVLRDGEPVLAIGAAGARRILSALVQVLSRHLDEGVPLPAAIAAPRLHPGPTRLYAEVRPDATWQPEVLAALERLGFEVRRRDEAQYFARIHAVVRDADSGMFLAVADPRGAGTAAAPGLASVGERAVTPLRRR